ncbi:MAG: hypothetical protein Q9208_002177 [Pyrenodesmia sp. 3 TL-2023]
MQVSGMRGNSVTTKVQAYNTIQAYNSHTPHLSPSPTRTSDLMAAATRRTSSCPRTQPNSPIGPGIEGIVLQIGEKLIDVEEQLLKAQGTLRETMILRDSLREELGRLRERENRWRIKVQEFDLANKAWAAQYRRTTETTAAPNPQDRGSR